MRDIFIIVPFVMQLPFQLPIPAEAGICLAGAALAAWLYTSPQQSAAPTASPLAGQEAPGKSQMLGFFSRVPDALAASGSYQTTDEGIPLPAAES